MADDKFPTLQASVQSLAGKGAAPALCVLSAVEEPRSIDYRELAAQVEAFAGGLRHAGIETGDRVAIMAENRPEWIVVALGILRAGAAVLPVDNRMSERSLRHVIPDGDPKLVVTTETGAEQLGWVDLSLEIAERTGIDLREETIDRIESVRDLLEAVNLDNVDVSGQWVLTPNHCSYLDPPALAAVLGSERLKHTHWTGARHIMLCNPWMRLVSRLARVLPIEVTGGARSALALVAMALQDGRNIVWFPEGGRSPEDSLQRFGAGTGILLDHFRPTVVPVIIRGTWRALPPDRTWPRRGKVTITFGDPIAADTLEAEGDGEQASERISNALHARMERMLAESRYPEALPLRGR